MNMKKISIDKILNDLLALLVVLNFNTVYYFSSEYTSFNAINKFLIILIIFLNISIDKVKRNKLKYGIKEILLYYTYIIIFALINNINGAYQVKEFFYYFIILLPLFILFVYVKGKDGVIELFKSFTKVIYIICIVSIFFYIFGGTLHFIPYTKYVNFTWSNRDQIRTYYNLYFETQYYGIGKKNILVARNSGIFCEPAMFAVMIIFAMMINKMYMKNKKLYNIFFLINLITTNSTTGIIMIIVYYVLDFIMDKKNRSIKLLIIPVLLYISLCVVINIFLNKAGTSSGTTRVDDIVACTKAWLKRPIFGNGFLNNEIIIQNLSSFRKGNQGISTSLFMVLAQGGIVLLSLYLYSFLKLLIYCIKTKCFNTLIALLIYGIIFVTTIFCYSALEMYIVAIGICSNIFYNKNK